MAVLKCTSEKLLSFTTSVIESLSSLFQLRIAMRQISVIVSKTKTIEVSEAQ